MTLLPELNISIFGHLAYLLILCSFLVRKILVLRLFAITASCFSIIYNYHSVQEPLWIPIQWNALFMGVNIYHIVMIILGKRQIKLESHLEYIYSKVFPRITKIEFKRLFDCGFTRSYDRGFQLIDQDENPEAIFLILSGSADIYMDEQFVARLEKGEFIGEMGFLTGQKTSATVVMAENSKVQYWDINELKLYLSKNPKLLPDFHSAIGNQLIKRLISSSQKASLNGQAA